jgi:hypothetical protein
MWPWRRKVHHDPEIIRRLSEIEHQNREILREIKALRPHKFTSSITLEGFEMSTSPTIPVPGNGVLNVNLFNADGSPFVPANFPGYTQNWQWALQPGTDPGVSIVPSADTLSCAVTVAASDVATSFVVGASGLDPAGNAQTPSLAVTLGASTGPQTFTSTITLATGGATPSFRR